MTPLSQIAPPTASLVPPPSGLHARVSRSLLLDALATLERVPPHAGRHPSLQHVHLDAQSGVLRLSVVTREVELECFVPADVQSPHVLSVPPRVLATLLRGLTQDVVTLTQRGPDLHVQAGEISVTFQTQDPRPLPVPTFPAHAEVRLDAAELALALGSVRHAVGVDTPDPTFRAIRLEPHPGSLRLVASDGFRLALREVPIQGQGRDVMLPAHSLEHLRHVLSAGDACLTFGERTLTVTTDRARMNLRLVDGTPPAYQDALPRAPRVQVTLPVRTLKAALRRVMLLADPCAGRPVAFRVAGNTLRLSAQGDTGQAGDTLDVSCTGEDANITVHLKGAHVLAALKAIQGDVTLRLSGPRDPVILQPADGTAYQAVVVTLPPL